MQVSYPRYIHNRHKHLKERCKAKGRAFNLTKSDIVQLYETKYCFYTGFMLQNPVLNDKQGTYTALSLERIDPSKGYVKGNVVAACESVNNRIGKISKEFIRELYIIHGKKLKGDISKYINQIDSCSLTEEEFKMVYAKMVEHYMRIGEI